MLILALLLAASVPSFRNDVIPVLTKAGCNQGACHGALAGKNGFKLTLRGYDPDVDYDTLTRQALGRRVNLPEPAQSLILLKPTFGIPHGGGKRFAPGSPEYQIIYSWIAAGAPPPTDHDPTVAGLEVTPPSARLEPNADLQLAVRARYSDGAVRDVTRWVKFSSSDESVATVDDAGRVKTTGRGEAAITLWYSSQVLYSRITVPFDNRIDEAAFARLPRRNYIDDLVLAKLKSLNIAPSRECPDSHFIRRAYLDAAGILPSAEEVEAFLAGKSPDKRARLIDQLLERDEFVDYWAYKWSDLLLVSSRKLRSNAMWAFYNWIRDSVKVNKPWDRFVREIFTSSGNSRQMGALNYWALHKDPIEITENVALAFLGQRITCARCHNHPLEKWTQKQYYQMANLFSRVGVKNGAEPGDVVVFAKTSGDINHPRLLRPLAPGFDVKRLIRTIMNSGAYQLSSEANATNQNDNRFYSKYIIRRLPAEVLLDAMSQVTGVPARFPGYPPGARALQLPDTQVRSEFLTSFGRPPRILCDAAERSSAPSIAQALHVINGDTLNRKLSAPDGFAALALKLGLSEARILDHLFLSAYSRYPNEAEKMTLLDALSRSRVTTGSLEAQREARRQALEDMMWALLTSKEFLFNY